MTDQPKLPTKLSELLLLAVADAKKCEAMPETYVLEMLDWHLPEQIDDRLTGKCAVCMAGAVIAQTLGADPSKELMPCDYEYNSALCAIDEMRCASFSNAADSIGQDLSASQLAACDAARALVRPAMMSTGRAEWHVYEHAAAILAEAGL